MYQFDRKSKRRRLLIVLNVDWYFLLHWSDRATAALNAGYQVHLAVGITDRSNLECIRKLGVIVHPVPIKRKSFNPFYEIKTFKCILSIVLSVKPSIVHTATIKPNVYAGIVSRIVFVPTVVSFPGMGTLFLKKGTLWSLARRIMWLLFEVLFDRKNCQVLFENRDDVIFYTNNVKPNKGKVGVIFGAGVDVEHFCFNETPEEELAVVLFAARIYRNKGLENLIESVDFLRKKGRRVELRVAGILDEDASDRIYERELISWEHQGRLKWLGRVNNMPDLISSATVVCQPSLTREGLPRIILEAMSCGRPVITSNVPGCREAVVHGETGLVVEPGDVKGLASAIDELILKPDMRRLMGRRAREEILNGYSTQIVQEKTLNIYENISLS